LHHESRIDGKLRERHESRMTEEAQLQKIDELNQVIEGLLV